MSQQDQQLVMDQLNKLKEYKEKAEGKAPVKQFDPSKLNANLSKMKGYRTGKNSDLNANLSKLKDYGEKAGAEGPSTIRIDPRESTGELANHPKLKKMPGKGEGTQRFIDPRESDGTLPTGSKTKKWKGKYVGPDKYKGVIPEHLKSKYKGKYFGPDSAQGSNNNASDLKAIGNKIKKNRGKKPGGTGTPLPPNTPGWTDESGVRHAGNEPGKKYAL
jgi:hypothetical protein